MVCDVSRCTSIIMFILLLAPSFAMPAPNQIHYEYVGGVIFGYVGSPKYYADCNSILTRTAVMTIYWPVSFARVEGNVLKLYTKGGAYIPIVAPHVAISAAERAFYNSFVVVGSSDALEHWLGRNLYIITTLNKGGGNPDEIRIYYYAHFDAEGKLFGLIPVEIPASVFVDASTQEVRIEYPWWHVFVIGKPVLHVQSTSC